MLLSGSLFSLEELEFQEEAQWVQCSHSSYLSNAICHGLYGVCSMASSVVSCP